MGKRWMYGGGALLGVVAIAVVVGLRMQQPAEAKAKADAKPSPTLEFAAGEVTQPQQARLALRVEFSGPLVAPGTAIVRAKAGGTLLALTVAEGQRVKAGQALGRIDLAEMAARAAERGAGVEAARTTLAQAERTHASNERLAAQQFISPIALDNSRAAVESARAQLAAAQASLDSTRAGLREAALVAPISGIVARRHVLPGEKVAAEQQVLTIVDLSRLELAASVGTHEVGRLAPGMAVELRVEGVDEPITARLARIAPAAEPGTRSIGVTFELANPGERLRAGMYALGRVEIADPVERLTVPLAAVASSGGQDHVWLIEGGALARRAVVLGRRDERAGRVEVLQGVAPGSTLLAARFDNLREGAAARVAAAPTPASPGPVASASAPALR